MKTHAIFPAVMAVTLAFAAFGASAHTDERHGKPKASAPVSAEEHPFGKQGDPRKVTRTITVDMSDKMHFTPSAITVKEGETIRFVVRNKGKLLHEMVIGTMADLKEHAEMMKKHPEMEHDEPYMTHVSAGQKENMVWQFTKPGEFYFACLIPGHFDAGMTGKIIVTGK